MAYTNSPLVNYTRLSPNHSSPRNHEIDTITIHCVVGQVTVERLGEIFAPSSRQASSNYGIGLDGKIGMYVEEKNRSWCSSNRDNDHRAITIECASDTKHPYAINDKVYSSLINLCVDICKRNNIKELKWKADKSLIGQPDKQNMTVHRWFASKSCPGDYIYSRLGQIADEVNARLQPENVSPEPVSSDIKVGDVVKVIDGATYYDGKTAVPGWVRNKEWIVSAITGERAVIDKSVDGANSINSPINVKYLIKVSSNEVVEKVEVFEPYIVKVEISNLNIRKGPGTNYDKNGFTGKGAFTIVEESSGKGSKKGWGKLKSGAGWISLDYARKLG